MCRWHMCLQMMCRQHTCLQTMCGWRSHLGTVCRWCSRWRSGRCSGWHSGWHMSSASQISNEVSLSCCPHVICSYPHIICTSSAHCLHETSVPRLFQVKEQRQLCQKVCLNIIFRYLNVLKTWIFEKISRIWFQTGFGFSSTTHPFARFMDFNLRNWDRRMPLRWMEPRMQIRWIDFSMLAMTHQWSFFTPCDKIYYIKRILLTEVPMQVNLTTTATISSWNIKHSQYYKNISY